MTQFTNCGLFFSENPLWTESALKYYEEQELSIQVNPDGILMTSAEERSPNSSGNQDLFMDSSSAHYATVMEGSRSTKTRQRQPDGHNADVSCRPEMFLIVC